MDIMNVHTLEVICGVRGNRASRVVCVVILSWLVVQIKLCSFESVGAELLHQEGIITQR